MTALAAGLPEHPGPPPWDRLTAAFGLELRRPPELLDEGKNAHYRLVTSTGDYVVRRCHEEKTPEAVSFEAELLAFLRSHGFPAPVLLPALDGQPGVSWWGRLHVVTRYEPGTHHETGNQAQVREVGRALGRYHRIVRAFRPTGAVPHRPPVVDRLRVALAALRSWQVHPPGGAEVREFRGVREHFGYVLCRGEQVLAVVDELYDRLPPTVIHGGCRRESGLFDGEALTCLLDYDSARTDQRVVDLAIAVNDFARVHDVADAGLRVPLDLDTVRQFVAGYRESCELRSEEAEGLRALLLVRRLHSAVVKFKRIHRGEPYRPEDAARFQLEVARARWLDAHGDELRTAVTGRPAPSGAAASP